MNSDFLLKCLFQQKIDIQVNVTYTVNLNLYRDVFTDVSGNFIGFF